MTGPYQEAAQTITNVMTDLVQIGMRWRDGMTADEAQATAALLDRLSEELAEAAALLRADGRRRVDLREHDVMTALTVIGGDGEGGERPQCPICGVRVHHGPGGCVVLARHRRSLTLLGRRENGIQARERALLITQEAQ